MLSLLQWYCFSYILFKYILSWFFFLCSFFFFVKWQWSSPLFLISIYNCFSLNCLSRGAVKGGTKNFSLEGPLCKKKKGGAYAKNAQNLPKPQGIFLKFLGGHGHPKQPLVSPVGAVEWTVSIMWTFFLCFLYALLKKRRKLTVNFGLLICMIKIVIWNTQTITIMH